MIEQEPFSATNRAGTTGFVIAELYKSVSHSQEGNDTVDDISCFVFYRRSAKLLGEVTSIALRGQGQQVG